MWGPNLGINLESRVLDVVEIASTILCYCVLRVLPLSLKVHRLGRPDLQIGEEPIQAKLNIITLNLKECGEKLGSEFKAHLPWISELQRATGSTGLPSPVVPVTGSTGPTAGSTN